MLNKTMTYEQFKKMNYERLVKIVRNNISNRIFKETGKLVYSEDIEKDVKQVIEKLINEGIVNSCTFEICHESEIL